MKKVSFTYEEINILLESILSKQLGEIDSKNVFLRTEQFPKITGIAGDVIEQSVLGMPGDNKQEPDILIDGVEFEVKTTGLKLLKRKNILAAKEPMSITAVSPNSIVEEKFFESKFWIQIEHLLIIYYLYNSDSTVVASEYKTFPIKGYQFLKLTDEDIKRLKNDWEVVRDFILHLRKNYVDHELEYPRISSETRKQLMLIDTAPKWPNAPRFRFKQSFLSTIVNRHFGDTLEQLPLNLNSFVEIDNYCNNLEDNHYGKTIRKLLKEYNLEPSKKLKSISELIVLSMFDANSKELNDIEVFRQSGLIAKTITLTPTGKRTEDMKLFRIDFDDFFNENITFEESSFYEYFSNHQLLIIKFEEPNKDAPLESNIFRGFERLSFSDSFIDTHVRKTWTEIRALIKNKTLEDVVQRRADGSIKVNKTGVISSAPNFPKSRSNIVFLRGSGGDSLGKTLSLNGIKMYQQYVWIKGSYIATMLNDLK